MQAQSDAIGNAQWAVVVGLARAYNSGICNNEFPEGRASSLKMIGSGLVSLGQYEEAIPVLRQCAQLFPGQVWCWYGLAEATMKLGRMDEARQFLQHVVAGGAVDQDSTEAIREAKGLSAEIEKASAAQVEQAPPVEAPKKSHGTGFFVTYSGHILTNNHVVDGCRSLALRNGTRLTFISSDPTADLALVRADVSPASVAVLRSGPAPRLGDSVVAFGYPLEDILSSAGNVSVGILSATSGFRDNPGLVQISAPVQPGNSGGALLDSSGHVIGVIVSKLDALVMARETGDVPQNVNFAIHWSQVRAFLDTQGIKYLSLPSVRNINTRDSAAAASRFSVSIECER